MALRSFTYFILLCMMISACEQVTPDVKIKVEESSNEINQFSKDSLQWITTHGQGTEEVYLTFLDSFPEGPYAEEAQFWLSTFEKNQSLTEQFKDPKLRPRKRETLIVSSNANLSSFKVRGKTYDPIDARMLIKEFIINPSRREIYASSPEKAIFSINSSGADSEITIHKCFMFLRSIYEEIYNEECQKRYATNYNPTLPTERKQKTREKYPVHILSNSIFPPKKFTPPPPVIE